MGFSLELLKAKRQIRQLEAELAKLKQLSGMERPSPKGVIEPASLHFYSDRLTIRHPRLIQMLPTGSDSMDPLFDEGDVVIGIEDFDRDSLIVGDMVVYHAGGGHYWSHRIVSILVDAQGRLYRLKGDNNDRIDPYLVRNQHIKYYIAGIIYIQKEGKNVE